MPVRVRGGGTEYRSVANALQIAAGVWAPPAHVLRSPDAGQYEVVLPDGGTIALTPCHRSADHDFAVFRSGSDWPWTARPQWGPAEPGERISLVGWLVGSAVSAVQATVDLTAQESQVPGLIAMIGPAPPAGSSGSALVVVRTGRVVGILTGVGALDRRQQAPGAGDTGVVIGVLPAAVPERLRSGAGTPADPPPRRWLIQSWSRRPPSALITRHTTVRYPRSHSSLSGATRLQMNSWYGTRIGLVEKEEEAARVVPFGAEQLPHESRTARQVGQIQ